MVAKIIILAALAVCGQTSVPAPLSSDTDYTNFAYGVADPHTGDYKSQVETRVGGAVTGQYSLIDADGTRRVVDYTADDIHGFNAVVRKEAVGVAPVVSAPAPAIPAPAPVVYDEYLGSPADLPAVVEARLSPAVRTAGPVARVVSSAVAGPQLRSLAPVAPVARALPALPAPLPVARFAPYAGYARSYPGYPAPVLARSPYAYPPPAPYSAPVSYW